MPHGTAIALLTRRVYRLCSDFDGDEVESEVFIEDGVLVMITRGNPCGPIKTVRKVDGDTLVISTTIVDKKVTATRTFKKQN